MLEIKDLSFAYRKGQNVFSGLELQINSGSICGLLGRNGAGKTTLLKIINGLLMPNAGNCNVAGFTPANREPDFLSDVYFVPEEIYVPSSVTIDMYLYLYAPFYKNFSREEFSSYIKEFELSDKDRLDALSYGQRKKFLIAFGLASKSRLLIMDEPTNGLDIPSKTQFRKLITSCACEGRTFIISTHQVRDLENLIDPVVILDSGRIIFNKSVSEVSDSYTDIEKLFNNVISNKEAENV